MPDDSLPAALWVTVGLMVGIALEFWVGPPVTIVVMWLAALGILSTMTRHLREGRR